MKRSYRGIIFDLDGVICFTDKYHYQAWKETANRLGVPFDRKINDRLRGVSRMESLEIILENYQGKLTQDEKEKLAEEKNEMYRKLLDTMTPQDLSPEVQAALDELRRRGVLMAVGSSSKNAKRILQRIGLELFFDAVADGNDIRHSKPDPEVFLCAAEKLGLCPAQCLVVEDAEAGIKAAGAGGFDSAGLGPAVKGQGTFSLNDIREVCNFF